MASRLALLAAAAVALVPFAAEAQSFRCVGSDGKKYYGSTIPRPCIGLPIEQLNAQGTVVRRIDPVGDEKQRKEKEAEAAKKREDDAIAKEENRRNRALLATYTSDKDIDEARGRALVDNQKQIKEIETRIAQIKKRKAGYDAEMEFYQDAPAKAGEKAKGSRPASAPKASKPPPKLLEDLQNAEIDLKAQENLLAVKQKEVDVINARYDEDKKRFTQLTGRK